MLVPDNIIVMKFGSHAGAHSDEILVSKAGDLVRAGVFMWGYNGTLCHPATQVSPFLRRVWSAGEDAHLVLCKSPSKWFSYGDFALERSVDGILWEPIPEGVETSGSRFAIECDELSIGRASMNLAAYEVAVGKSEGVPLNAYLRGRVSKACAKKARRLEDGCGGPQLIVSAVARITGAFYLR